MIKIHNIYYMLAYAFRVLNEEGYRKVALEDFEYAEDLLAAILAKGISNLVRRGVGREYVLHTDHLSSPRGKINISASITGQSFHKKQLICEFDELSENTYVNQILKTTALQLIHSDEVRELQKKSLKRVLYYFNSVDSVNLNRIQWSSIKYHRNNSTYRMLMHICYLVIEALLPTQQVGTKRLMQFKDEHMSRLFERFVLEYYRKEHPSLGVSSPIIQWNVDDGFYELLPNMRTDITLTKDEKTLIIDTKYYSRLMQVNSQFNSRTIHSGNLYQIFSYVKNFDTTHSGNVSGLLLYAKTDKEIAPNNSYLMDGNRIGVKTLDLNKDFTRIREQLDSIIDEAF